MIEIKLLKVFLDLKFHDIPNTVASSCRAAADLGVWMLNVHASGGLQMMQAARKAVDEYDNRPLLIAVTVLTSMANTQLPEIGVSSILNEHVSRLANLALLAKLDGVVCSALEVAAIKKSCGKEFIAITPGIRMGTDIKDDQSRIITPDDAIGAGSDYIVVGRPVTQSKNPQQVVKDLLTTISSVALQKNE
jgi:orotidine-5'-phosphate decarboxylase